MNYTSFLPKFLLILLYFCCCSFSAVPVKKAPPQKTHTAKVKRQIRQQKRQLLRLYRHQLRTNKQLQQPPKNHAFFNQIGFLFAVGGLLLFVAGIFVMLAIFGFSSAANVPLLYLLLFCIGIEVAAFVLCLIGLTGHKKTTKPKIGFGVAGLIICSLLLTIALLPIIPYLLFIMRLI